jgi:hypothetical protein
MLFPVSRHERKYRMSIGHRIFVVEEDAVFPISQKTFTALYSGKVGALPKFAGQTVQIAVVVYTVLKWTPLSRQIFIKFKIESCTYYS